MISIVTGGAGFIGSHLVDSLVRRGRDVRVIDNFSSGKMDFLEQHSGSGKVSIIRADLLKDDIRKHFAGADEVWHLAANPDVRILDPEIHVNQNLMATKNVLDAMQSNGIGKISFTSSSTVYGEAVSKGSMVPTPESHSLEPISLYGAMKLASEALIGAYCHSYGMQCWLFRFANVIGPRSTHGIIFDLIKKLEKDPKILEILGDGKQKKSYVYISDCIEAMLTVRENASGRVNIYNIGSDDWIEVRKIAELVCKCLGLEPELQFTGGDRGWKGDVPLMILDNSKIKELGWKPSMGSEEAVIKTIRSLGKENQ